MHSLEIINKRNHEAHLAFGTKFHTDCNICEKNYIDWSVTDICTGCGQPLPKDELEEGPLGFLYCYLCLEAKSGTEEL